MQHDKILNSDFYLQFPFTELLTEQMEVIGANPHGLLLWYRGRTTVDYELDGIRCGGVLGLSPLNHSKIAEDLTRCGMPSTARQVRRWDERLHEQGTIARHRTPIGYRVLVMDSFKFLDDRVKKLPKWAGPVVMAAASKRPSPVCRRSDRRSTAIQERAAVTDPKGAIRPPSSGDQTAEFRRSNIGDSKETQEKSKRDSSQLVFSTRELKITEQQHKRFRVTFPHVDLGTEYHHMAAYIAANEENIERPGLFAFRWRRPWLNHARATAKLDRGGGIDIGIREKAEKSQKRSVWTGPQT